MNYLKKIKAFLLLSVISIMILHNALPHIHHIHHKLVSSETTHNHSHDGHSHHHHSSDEKKQDTSELQSKLPIDLEGHAHSVHTYEDVTISKFKSEITKTQKVVSEIGFVFTDGYYTIAEKLDLHRNFLYEEPFYESYVFQNIALRAPPTIA
ncbi:hypothetical protein [Aureivirga sp. CE67]|uniref:hypothetical protein n=1 Tax=Aureivirga sp. CE67 TaxID=1788983 RepID=UPI0018C9573A|nr:hypothetical protein [Aureivirga sp. CE67]